MKSVLVILVITCLAGLFDFSTADTLYSCNYDSDCYRWGDTYCINRRCYSKKSYGFSCSYDRQCDEPNQRCSTSHCECRYNYKREGGRCVWNDGTWSTGKSVGVTIGVLIVVVAIIAGIEIRRRRARQITQALLQSQATTTVVQPTYIAQPGPPQPVYQAQPTVAAGYHPGPPQYGKY